MARPRTRRQQAFAKELHDWLPEIGETVFVRRVSGNLSFIQSTGVVTGRTLYDELYIVTITRGRQQSIGEWWLTDLRPERSRAVAVVPAPTERR